MLRGTCLSCYRLYARASAAAVAFPDGVTSSCDGKRCVARSSANVTVPRSGCNGGCASRQPPASRMVATAAAAASAAAAAEMERRRRRERDGVALGFISRAEGRASSNSSAARKGARSGGGRMLRASPPPMFGRTVPTFGRVAGGTTLAVGAALGSGRMIHTESPTPKPADAADEKVDDDDEDCPVCRKYSRGPCGEFFKSWRACADAHPGRHPDLSDGTQGEELHLTKCEDLAVPLARCLENHEEYYAGPLDDIRDDDGQTTNTVDKTGSKDNEKEGRELRRAWSGLVDDLEHIKENRPRLPFPHKIEPEMEVRLSTNEGMASFAPHHESNSEEAKPLILAYVKDNETGELLGAGSSEDVRAGGGVMRFGVRDGTREVTACALYGGEEGGPIYRRTQVLPPRESKKT